MPTDPSIIMAVKPPAPPPSPLDVQGKQLDIQQARQTIEENARKMADEERARAEQQTINRIYQSAATRDGTIDNQTFLSGLAGAGLGHLVPQYQKQFVESDKAAADAAKLRADAQESKIKADLAEADYFGNVFAEIKASGYSPTVAHIKLDAAQRAGHDVTPFQQALQSGMPLPQAVDMGIAGSAKQRELLATEAEKAAQTRRANLESDNIQKYGSATPPNLQSENVMYQGKPIQVTFNPRTGKRTAIGPDGAEMDVTGKTSPIPAAAAQVSPNQMNDVKEAIAGMKDGTIPPQLPGRASKDYTAIMAEAHRQGYDLESAVTDWNATQKQIATLNGQQQTRLRQSVNALPELLDSVEDLAAKWKGGKSPVLNRVNLAAAKAGAYGQDLASIARQLDAQIADVTADLANVYMGGNSPTDHAIDLASKSLSGDWSEKVLRDMIALARKNVTIRQNSIKNTGVAGASPNNPYAPPAAAPSALPKVGDTFNGGKVLKIEKIK